MKEKMKAVDYKGIDYGLGRTNISKSGIRYGVIPQHEVLQAWADSSEPAYGKPTCPECGNAVVTRETETEQMENGVRVSIVADERDAWPEYSRFHSGFMEYACDNCKHLLASEDVWPEDPQGFELQDGEYSAHCGEDGDIFILDSPYFTYAQFCSPCAPGACYLLNPLETRDENNRAFCFGHDWFEDGRAPYPVYSVKTGQLIEPEASHVTQRRD